MHQDFIIIIIIRQFDNEKVLPKVRARIMSGLSASLANYIYRLAFNISTQFIPRHASLKFLQSTPTLPSLTASKKNTSDADLISVHLGTSFDSNE